MPDKYIGLLILLLVVVMYLLRRQEQISTFVPYNVTEAPDSLQLGQGKSVHQRFGELIQLVNTSSFALSYRLNDMIAALRLILESVAPGKYTILSVGEHQHFALKNVVLQENATLATVKLASVDFALESMNPFRIQKVILMLDSSYNDSRDVKPNEGDRPGYFQISNPLHLFYPYHTSDNAMAITTTDAALATDNIAYLAAPLRGSP